jgi:hypothetical protein
MIFRQLVTKLNDGVLVSTEKIELFKSCYRANNWMLNSERRGDEETIYVLLPIEDLIEFTDKSKAMGADYIAIYFGAFPIEFTEYSLLAGRMTLCFVGIDKHTKAVYYGEDQPEFGVGGFNSKSHVESFTENYRLERYGYNTRAIGKADSIGVTCTIETFKDFLAEKENAAFIRIYIGAYPDHYAEAPLLSKMQNVVLVRMEESANRFAKEMLEGENPGLNMVPILLNDD